METPLSKNQQKKLKKQELWLKKKQEKKAHKKKNKSKPNCLFRSNRSEWDLRKSQGLKLIIDCDFDTHLTDKEKSSLKQQIMYSHALNKRSDHPVDLAVTGVSNYLREELSKVS